MRKQFSEPYRTLIGHLRHEVGHYFWDRLIYKQKALKEYRAILEMNEQTMAILCKTIRKELRKLKVIY
jgi:hypothetical protein